MSERPMGVLVVAMLHFIEGAVWLAVSVWLFMLTSDAAKLPPGFADAAKYVLWGAVLVAGVGAGYFATGYGLWNLRQWGLAAAMALAGLTLLLEVIGIIQISSVPASLVPSQTYMAAGIYAAVAAGMLAYLLQPQVREGFDGAGGAGGGRWRTACVACGRRVIESGMPVCPRCGAPQPGITRTPPPPKPEDVLTQWFEPRPPLVAWLVVRGGPDHGKQFSLDGTTLIGRASDCQIKLQDLSVSRAHARIRFEKESGRFRISDLDASAGTFVNEMRCRAPRLLFDGDIIRLGGTTLEFKRTTGQ